VLQFVVRWWRCQLVLELYKTVSDPVNRTQINKINEHLTTTLSKFEEEKNIDKKTTIINNQVLTKHHFHSHTYTNKNTTNYHNTSQPIKKQGPLLLTSSPTLSPFLLHVAE
jgi:hypothetical protein